MGFITDTPVGRDATPDAGEDARTTLDLVNGPTLLEICAPREQMRD